MADLVAKGWAPEQLWRRALPEGAPIILGREAPGWSVPWDRSVSREHAELSWRDGRLRVRRLPAALNPIYFRGDEASSFTAAAGETFTIGRTKFTVEVGPSAFDSAEGHPVLQSWSVSDRELREVAYRDAPYRIDVLRGLTDLIASAIDDRELHEHLVDLILAGIRRAEAVALVQVGYDGQVRTLHARCRHGESTTFRPSRRLVREAIERLRDSVVHLWAAGVQDEGRDECFTSVGNLDWAFCTPVRGEACQGWGIYAAGRLSGLDPRHARERSEIDEEVKFAELVAAILSSIRQVQTLQRQQAVLNHFFSPEVVRLLGAADPETALAPTETNVTTLICDLRGFSRKVETSADQLRTVLERVSGALGVMTRHIFEHRGVVADFQGDSAMAFWGWPLVQPDMVASACLAALAIRDEFETFASQPGHPLADFRAGIGVASGRAVAGRIGTTDQSKITAFGPVVNLASRLEGLTKVLRVPILLDESTARVVRASVPPEVARCRRLAVVRPYGLEQAVAVSELLPPAAQCPLLTDDHLRAYEEALDAFLAGDWATAYERLHQVPPRDLGKDFILGQIIQHDHAPPTGWNGVVSIARKD